MSIKRGFAPSSGKDGLGIKQRDYLRQVIRYEKPYPWEKENYRIEEKYKGIVKDLLSELKNKQKGE